MSEVNTEGQVMIDAEKLEKLKRLEAIEAREKKLKALFEGENGTIYKKAYEQGGLKERLDKNPEVIDNDIALATLFDMAMDKILTEDKPKPEAENNTEQEQAPSATPPIQQQPPTQPQSVNIRTVEIDELVEKGKLSVEMAAELKAFY